MINVVREKLMENDQKTNFGRLLSSAIEIAGVKKKLVAAKADIKEGSLSRILNGEHGVKKPTAAKLIEAVNELAGREVINLQDGLAVAGYSPFKIEATTEEDALLMTLLSKHRELSSEQKEQFRPFVEMLVRELDVIGSQEGIRTRSETAQRRADFIPLEERESRVIDISPEGRIIEEAPFDDNPKISSRKEAKKKNGTAG